MGSEGTYSSTASRGTATGSDLVVPASAFVDGNGAPVQDGFPEPYYTYYVSVAGVELPRLAATVLPDRASVRILKAAALAPETPISVGPKASGPSAPSTTVPRSGMDWLHLA